MGWRGRGRRGRWLLIRKRGFAILYIFIVSYVCIELRFVVAASCELEFLFVVNLCFASTSTNDTEL